MKELIDALVSQLGVNDKQARGGAGVLFKAARDKLGNGEFDKLVGKVSGIEDLIKKVPEASWLGKLFGGLASSLGGDNAALIANVVTGFGRLGLTQEHAKSFAPVILKFLRAEIGTAKAAKLEKALRA